MNPGRVVATIHAGDIELTENRAGVAGRQIKMGHELYVYITPETAAQWLPVIASIAGEA
jgi:hypothetical protein